MTPVDVCSHPRWLVWRHFLEEPLCARLRAEARGAVRRPAQVFKPGEGYGIDTDTGVRKTALVDIAGATRALLQERLLTLKPALEQHFHVTLEGCESPQCLIYRAGDFFTPHYDRAGDTAPAAVSYLTARQVSVVLFLTSQADQAGAQRIVVGPCGSMSMARRGSSSWASARCRSPWRRMLWRQCEGTRACSSPFVLTCCTMWRW